MGEDFNLKEFMQIATYVKSQNSSSQFINNFGGPNLVVVYKQINRT